MMWAYIESAPKDGSWIVAWSDFLNRPVVVYWNNEPDFNTVRGWSDDEECLYDDLTHYLPCANRPPVESEELKFTSYIKIVKDRLI